MMTKAADVTHVKECLKKFGRCRKDEFFSLVNAPYTGVLDCRLLCFGEEVEHHSPHFMVWGAMNREHLFKSCFFDGLVNHLYY